MRSQEQKTKLRKIWKRSRRFLEYIVTAAIASGISGYVTYSLTSQDAQPDITKNLGITMESFQEFTPEWRRLVALAATAPGELSSGAQRIIREATPEQASTIVRLAGFVIGGQMLFRQEGGPSNKPFPEVFSYQLMELQSLGIVSGGSNAVSISLEEVMKDEASIGIDAETFMIVVSRTDRASSRPFTIAQLTTAGQEIVDNLRVPPDVDHLSSVLALIESRGWETELWAKWERTGPLNSETQIWPVKARYKVNHGRKVSRSEILQRTLNGKEGEP